MLVDPNDTDLDLSTDQEYLLQMCQAVSKGVCPEELARKSPGNISHARWLTTANRILRLYITESKPSKNLTKLAKNVVLVYAPTWFEVKRTKSCVEGSKLFFKMIERTRYMPMVDKKVIHASISNNGYFAHPENILLSMIFDENPTIRQKAVSFIRSAKKPQSTDIRKFKIPLINFKASCYYEMVNLKNTIITVPPLVANIPLHEIEGLWKTPRAGIIKKNPCHSQAVERCVKLVSEASATVTQIHRHGFILNKIKSRKVMPIFNSKKEFNLNS